MIKQSLFSFCFLINNRLNNSLGGVKFGKDGDGNVGYYGADGSLIPFRGANLLNNVNFLTSNFKYSTSFGYNMSAGTVTKNSTFTRLDDQGYGSFFYSEKPINVTNLRKIIITRSEYKNSDYAGYYYYIGAKQQTAIQEVSLIRTSNSAGNTVVIDVSDLSGDYYLQIGLYYTNGYVDIQEIIMV